MRSHVDLNLTNRFSRKGGLETTLKSETEVSRNLKLDPIFIKISCLVQKKNHFCYSMCFIRWGVVWLHLGPKWYIV